MQRINVTPLVKPILDAFHHGQSDLSVTFRHDDMKQMYGSDYADKFVALTKALDYKQSAVDYLRSEDFTIEQLKAVAKKVGYTLGDYEWDDDNLTEAFSNAIAHHGVEQFDVHEMTVYNTSRTYFKWEDNDETLYSSFRQMVEDSNDDVLAAFKAAGEEPLDHLDPHTVRDYIENRVDNLIEYLEDEAVDSPDIWQKLAGTPEQVEANAWYALAPESGRDTIYPDGAVEFNGMMILPVKE